MLSLLFLVAAPSLTAPAIIPQRASGSLMVQLVIAKACQVRVDRAAGQPDDSMATGDGGVRGSPGRGMTDDPARVSCDGNPPIAVTYSRGVDAHDRVVTISF